MLLSTRFHRSMKGSSSAYVAPTRSARRGRGGRLPRRPLEPDGTRHGKGEERTGDIPIVIATGLDGATLESHAHHAMCDGLVTKPCPPDSMVALLDALTASRDAESPDGS